MHAQCGNGHIMNNENKNIKGEKNSPRRKFTGKNYKKPKSKKNEFKNKTQEENKQNTEENVNVNLQNNTKITKHIFLNHGFC